MYNYTRYIYIYKERYISTVLFSRVSLKQIPCGLSLKYNEFIVYYGHSISAIPPWLYCDIAAMRLGQKLMALLLRERQAHASGYSLFFVSC